MSGSSLWLALAGLATTWGIAWFTSRRDKDGRIWNKRSEAYKHLAAWAREVEDDVARVWKIQGTAQGAAAAIALRRSHLPSYELCAEIANHASKAVRTRFELVRTDMVDLFEPSDYRDESLGELEGNVVYWLPRLRRRVSFELEAGTIHLPKELGKRSLAWGRRQKRLLRPRYWRHCWHTRQLVRQVRAAVKHHNAQK